MPTQTLLPGLEALALGALPEGGLELPLSHLWPVRLLPSDCVPHPMRSPLAIQPQHSGELGLSALLPPNGCVTLNNSFEHPVPQFVICKMKIT